MPDRDGSPTPPDPGTEPAAARSRRRRSWILAIAAASLSLFMYVAFITKVGMFGIAIPKLGGGDGSPPLTGPARP